MKMTVNTFLFSGVLPLMAWMVRICLLIVSHIHELFICLSLWSDIYWIILCDSAVLTHHFLFPNAYNFYRFWGILRNNNCHREMSIHVFQLSVHIPVHGSWLCIPSGMFYQHMCILFMELSEFLNYPSRFHFHLVNESPHCCLLSINVHQY